MINKHGLAFLLIACLMVSIWVPAFAASGTFQYADYSGEEGIILTDYNGPGGELVIPAEYNGKRVVAVGDLGGNKSVTKVTVSEGITYLSGSFQNMTSLKEVVLPHSLKEIWSFTFCNTGLTALSIPQGVTTLLLDAICNNANLQSISIPASCEVIPTAAIHSNPALQVFSIDSANPNWTTTANGVLLMHKETREVVSCAGGAVPSTLTVPDRVTALRSFSLAGCPSLETLILPESIDGLDGDVIINCPKLKTVYAKAAGFDIAPYAFYQIPEQVTVYCNRSSNMENPLYFTVEPYVSGMESTTHVQAPAEQNREIAATPDTPSFGALSANNTKTEAPTTSDSELTSDAEFSTEPAAADFRNVTQVTAVNLAAQASDNLEEQAPESYYGWWIGGAVCVALLAAGVAMVILKKKGKIQRKKQS